MQNNDQVAFKGIIISDSEIVKGYLTTRRGKIIDIGESPPGCDVIDLGESYITPGFIDLHIHGIQHMLVDNGGEDLKEICKILPQYGVTGFLPTLAPRPKGEDAEFLSELSITETEGTEILGFHLEGPFLKITGALGAGATCGADEGRVQALIQAAKPYRAIFSISPDVEGIDRLIPFMAENNTPVFITHTAATVEQTQRAIALGARHATHFYDVFPCPPVSEPGVRPCGAVEAILADERVGVDFILDGVHVDPIAVKTALKCKSRGPGKVCLITDANVGAGLGAGRFVFGNSGEIEFAHKGAPARLVKDNTLAGSGLTMDRALKNAVKWLGLDLVHASKLVSHHPAMVLGIGHKKGILKKGYDADFVVLNENLDVLQTWINGKCFFERK
ncbi:N-acetylglucosamine-6-phosphate deacetylase [Proteiniphilum sp. X52]|uniref:N-acetylglucosamine-6-phosphate deacetylase n=1 Tax=Proteiniphilum sp. X52 TaxID=2382159 RepID=UPI001314D507|nr:amidohydrolase family protein [Proteiniphilum sp. X52]